MKLSMFQPIDPRTPLFFNVEWSVGKGGQNATEDVLLVQFLLRLIGEIVPAGGPEGEKDLQIMRSVLCSGTCDQKTIDGIMAFQRDMRRKISSTIVDGRVSSANGYHYGSGVFTIVAMNGFIRENVPKVNGAPTIWPRLQDFKDCPPALKTKISTLL